MDPETPPSVGLEAAIASGLEASTGRDLMDGFVDDITNDLPVQAPGDPTPKDDPEPEKKEKPEDPDNFFGNDPEPEPEKKEKPEEADPEVPELPKGSSAKARESWDKLRDRGDRYKQESLAKDTTIAEFKTAITAKDQEIADLKAKAARAAELEERQKEFDEMSAEMSVYRIESSPEYKKAITEPFKALDSAIDTLVKSNEGADLDAVIRMINEADPVKQRQTFKEVTAGWDEVDRADLWGMTKSARELFDKQDAMRANASAAQKERETLAAQRETETAAARRNEFNTASVDAVKAIMEKTPFVPLVEGETAEDRANALTAKLKDVDFDSQSPRGKAFAAAAALEYPKALKVIAKLQTDLAAANARIEAANKLKPKSEDTSSPTPKPDAGEDDDLFNFDEPAGRLSHSISVVGV